MKKQLLALLLATVLMVALISGCANETQQPTSPSPATTTASSSSNTSDPGTQDKDGDKGISTLLSDELVTINIWSPFSPNYGSVISSYNDCLGYKEVEAKTNVHVDWRMPAIGSENEQFQLLIAGLDYPDAIINFTQYYSPGLENAVELVYIPSGKHRLHGQLAPPSRRMSPILTEVGTVISYQSRLSLRP